MEEAKQRMIQEYVPGRQVTLAHVIANPQDELARKVGLTNEKVDAIGILTITPGEAAIIAGDLATKSAAIEIGFVDRFSGSVILNGDVSSVEAAISDIVDYFKNVLRFSVTEITRS
ncbi:ethanolamine utilization microcompartment protein EutS [Leptotrichia sp. oral taxon 221]|jgi:microcompartments protein|uniref:ethanolamine utilization microcompartment protein EutS n=1 Tax=Leptotrichia sp. oral taxon 221 TaxID=712362 RepID=UPI001B8A9CD1|nr:BMC domain-containing protein [Leptotrichia sp. oral taxon 221]QUB97298.1 BMC domain-containing protein [Leptotrichia sp. oral taxon 221]